MKFTKILAIAYIFLIICSSIVSIKEKVTLTRRYERRIQYHSHKKTNTNKNTTSVKAYLQSILTNCPQQPVEEPKKKSPTECLGDFDYLEFVLELVFSMIASLEGEVNKQLKAKMGYNQLMDVCFIPLGKAIEDDISKQTNIVKNMVNKDLHNNLDKMKKKLHLMPGEADVLDCKKDRPKELCEIGNNLHKLSEQRISQKIDIKNKRIKSLVNILSKQYNLQDIKENVKTEYDYIVRLYKTQTYLKKIQKGENTTEPLFENNSKMKEYFTNAKDENLWKTVKTHHEIKFIIFERILKLKEQIKSWKRKLVVNKSIKKPVCRDLPEKADECLDIGITTLLFGFFRSLKKQPSLLVNCGGAIAIAEGGVAALTSKIAGLLIGGIASLLGAGILRGFAIAYYAIQFWKSYREAKSYSDFVFPKERVFKDVKDKTKEELLEEEKIALVKTNKSGAWGRTIGYFIKVIKLIIGYDNMKRKKMRKFK
jgi:hypothetical protein